MGNSSDMNQTGDIFTEAPHEVELKYDLGEAETVQRLVGMIRGYCAAGGTVEQENYFYDTADFDLGQRKIALRLRIVRENDKVVGASIALKGETEQTDEVATRPEIEVSIDEETAREIKSGKPNLKDIKLEPVERIRALVGEKELLQYVSFNNQRETLKYSDSGRTFVLELDRTDFKTGETDFELEIESADAELISVARKLVAQLFGFLQIPLIPQTKSKLQRALEYQGAK